MTTLTTTTDHAPAVVAEPALPSLASTLRHVALVQEILKNVMKEGTHYGASFPGDQKKNLLKPGADALALAFRLVPDFTISERDLGHDHREYQVTCRLLTQASGTLIATGVGSCSSKEGKYRYRNDKPKCPACGQIAVIKTKRGYWCVPDKGGCGANPDAAAIESQPRGKIENPDPADVWNTVLKMAKKRAYVDATITATAASDLFTQDLEDLEGIIDRAEEKAASAQPRTAPHASQPPTPAAPAAGAWTPELKTEAKAYADRIAAHGDAAKAELTKLRTALGARKATPAESIDELARLAAQWDDHAAAAASAQDDLRGQEGDL